VSWITGRNVDCGSQVKDKYKKIWALSLVTRNLYKVTRNTDMSKHISKLASKCSCNRIYNAHRNTPMSEQKRGRIIALPIFKLNARRGWLDNAMPRTIQPQESARIPIVEEVWWTTEHVWTNLGREIILSHRGLNPDRTACRQSLYLLRHPSHNYSLQFLKCNEH
jgi:hypothetical protein